MKVLLISACFIAAVAATAEDSYSRILFAKFQAEHSKEYKSKAEHSYRLSVFAENVKMINEHNKAGHSYQKGKNRISFFLFYFFLNARWSVCVWGGGVI